MTVKQYLHALIEYCKPNVVFEEKEEDGVFHIEIPYDSLENLDMGCCTHNIKEFRLQDNTLYIVLPDNCSFNILNY